MKTLLWLIKCISSIILLVLSSKDKIFGIDILWADLQLAIDIDIVILIILYLYTTANKK